MAFDNFTAVVYTEKIGSTPAAVNHRTGVLYINPEVFDKYPKHWQEFILLHELGHLVLDTKNELAADEFAFRHFIRNGGSLRESVLSLSEVLDVNNNPSHYIRAREQLKRAQEWDEKVNGINIGKISKQQAMCNTKAHHKKHVALLITCIENGDKQGAREQVAELLMHADPREQKTLVSKYNDIINQMDEPQSDEIGAQFLSGYASSDNYLSPFLGLGKKAQARRDQRAAARAELLKARAEAKKLRAQAALTKAEKGTNTNVNQMVGDIAKGASNIVGSIFGGKPGGGTEEQPVDSMPTGMPDPGATDGEEKKSNVGLYIGIAVALLIIAAIVAYFMLRKKS